MTLDESLGSASTGLQAVPFVANTASSIATRVENVLPFGRFGDLKTSSRYITAEKALIDNLYIFRVVGDSLGRSVVLESQKNHPELKSRTYSAPVVDVAVRPNANADRYRMFGNPISMFDTSTQTPMNGQVYDQQTLTHQYQNNAK